MSDMSRIKPLVTPGMVLPVLQDYFGRPIHHLQRLAGGNVAQAFSFTVAPGPEGAARDYVVRFNATMLVNFEKEAYCYEHFASPRIPIPRVVHRGRLGNVHFAISEKAAGQNLLQIPRAAYLALIPQQMALLDAIHHIPVGARPGYGIFDGQGVAPWPSWRAHLEGVRDEEPAGDFYGNWHTLFETSFLERDWFEQLFRQMEQRIGYCPEERYLVHGGYGFGNVLAQEGQITAVLDWMDAKYGDFLFDVAWLDFWSPEDGWQERFAQHYRQAQRAVPFYRERVLCYQCYMALEALKFYAKGGDKAGYGYASRRIGALLQGG